MTVAAPPSPAQLRQALSSWLRSRGDEFLAVRAENEPRPIEEAMQVDREFQRALWDAGFTRHGWPESVGGSGGTAALRATLYEHLGLEGYRVPLPLGTLEVLGPVMVSVAPELSARFLGACIRGDEVWCQGFSEPEAGSDLAALRCRAVPDGDGWRVTGQKMWSSFGSLSDKSAALVRTGPEGHRGISMFLIDLDSPGIEVRPTRASSDRNEFAETFFDNVFVPGDRIVGAVNAGWGIAMTLLQWERGMYAWQRQSVLHARLAEASRAVPHPTPAEAAAIGDAWVRVTALRSAAARTVRRLAAGENPGPEISVDKVLLATTEQAVEDLFRLLDPAAFVLGHTDRDDLHRADWFYSRMATIYGGAIEIQRSIIAERVLGLPRAGGR
ncbi:MAG TPA: acyl-CoA dehydrogenase family protein [Acidimicrobiales bacterium]|jgi:alkylation response protein AidB-like acyl-CoA dehydrogenase